MKQNLTVPACRHSDCVELSAGNVEGPEVQVVDGGIMETSSKENGEGKRPRQWSQHLAALVANLATLGSGAAMGWSAPAVPVLRGEQPDASQALRLSLEQSTWVGALIPLGALLGALPAGPLAQRVGRKSALLAHALPVLTGWLLILFAGQEMWLLYAGRFLTGLGVGAYIVIVAMYSEEIAEVRVRGIIGSYLDLSTSTGLFLVYVYGALLPYFWFTAASLIPTAGTLILFWWMPESPVFLMARNREAAARRSLRWLRGPAVDIEPELETLRHFKDAPESSRSAGSLLAACCSKPKFDRATTKALIIVFGLMFFSQATGGTGFVYYTEDVFREANSGLAGDICMMIIGAVSVMGTFLSILLVDRVGRRFILTLSSICLGVSLLVFSVYSHFNTKGYDLSLWNWIPLLCLVVFMFNISFGYGPIKYFMMAELMPAEAKGWGSSVCVCFSRIFSVILAKFFPIMLASLGQDVTYAIFCVFCFLGTLFIILFVPETKGKTREQIQQELVSRKRKQIQTNALEKDEC